MWQKVLKIFSKRKPEKPSNGKKILIVDDSEIDRSLVGKLLGRTEYSLLFANDGESALKIVRRQKPDLIILDCVMPGMSGTEVCQIIKKDHELKHIPIIFLTGMDSPTYVINCYEIGAEHYLTKPINSRELISQINLTLGE